MISGRHSDLRLSNTMLLPAAMAGGHSPVFAVFPCRRCFLAVFLVAKPRMSQEFCGFPAVCR
jgi:hypothetical protein